MSVMRKLLLGFMWVCLIWSGLAQTQPEANSEALEDLSLEALLNLKTSLASRTEQNLAEAPSIVSVITGQELSDLGFRNMVEVLRSLAGFDVVQNPLAGNQALAVRGILSTNSTNNIVKVMLNGHSFHSVGGGPHHYFGQIPLDNIKQVEIIRGPGSALYGANAFSAVINIVTRDADQASTVAFDAGSYQTSRSAVVWAEQRGELGFSLTAAHSKTEGPHRTISGDFATLIGLPSAAPGPMNLGSENHNIQTRVVFRNWTFSGFFDEVSKDIGVGIAGALTDENRLKVRGNFIDLGYKNTFSQNRGEIKFNIYYNYFSFFESLEILSEETTAILPPGPSGPFPAAEGLKGEPGVRHSLGGTELSLGYDLENGVSFLAGLLYDDARTYRPSHSANGNVADAPLIIDGVAYFPNQYLGGTQAIGDLPNGNWIMPSDRLNSAGYLQFALDFTQIIPELQATNLALTLGLRYDEYSDIGNTTNPRAGLVYAPNDRFYFKALYGRAFRAPTFDELFQINNPTNRGNPDLRPETLRTVELLVGYNAGNRLQATLSFYDSVIKDNIRLIQREYENGGEIRSKGIEGEAKYYFSGRDYFFLNFSFQNAENTTREVLSEVDGNGQPVSFRQQDYFVGYVPDLIANLGGHVELNSQFSLSAHLNYASKRDRSEQRDFVRDPATGLPLNGQTRFIDPRAGQPTPGRTLLDTNLIWQPGANLSIKFSCYNLFDEDYQDPDFTLVLPVDIPRERASYYLSTTFEF